MTPASRAVVQALIKLDIAQPCGDSHFRMQCQECGQRRLVDEPTLFSLRLTRAVVCEPCQRRLGMAKVTVG